MLFPLNIKLFFNNNHNVHVIIDNVIPYTCCVFFHPRMVLLLMKLCLFYVLLIESRNIEDCTSNHRLAEMVIKVNVHLFGKASVHCFDRIDFFNNLYSFFAEFQDA